MPWLDTLLHRNRNSDPLVDVSVTPQPATVTDATRTGRVTMHSGASDATDAVGAGTPVAPVGSAVTPAVSAVKQMRELVESGKLRDYYDAAIGLGKPELKQKALDLFAALPKVNAHTSADEMVQLGLWTTAPRGIAEMQKTARYLPGREMMIETTVNDDLFDGTNFLTYKAGGRKGITHRATLVGEEGNSFLVKVDGRDEPVKQSKRAAFALNQPNNFEDPHDPDKLLHGLYGGGLSRKVDYNEGFMKAKIAEAAIKMDELVARLDFTKVAAPTSTGRFIGRTGSGRAMVDIQRACVKVVHDVIDMTYPSHGGGTVTPGRNRGETMAGRSAVKGTGVCDAQAAVMTGILWPFHDKLGVDLKMYYGSCYRFKKPGDDPFSRTNSNGKNSSHSWLQLDYRPSMERRICDRTWSQADMPADRAYCRYGDRYPMRDWYNPPLVPGSDSDINCSGDITVGTVDRQFGVLGRDGRDNHQ